MNTQKPASIAYMEFKSSIVSAINNCNLPPFVIESVLREYLHEISELAATQYREDVRNFTESSALTPENNDATNNQE